MWQNRIRYLLFTLALLLPGTGLAVPGPEGVPAPEPAEQDIGLPAAGEPVMIDEEPSCIRRDATGRFLGWMDYHHCVFSGRTLATASWFDDLFGDWGDDEASLLLSAISEVTFEEGGTWSPRLRLRASADLPNAKQRLRLVVSDEDDDYPARRDLRDRRSRQSAALRWMPRGLGDFRSDFDVGVRGIDPPDVYARLRLRRSWPFWQESVLRFGQTFRYGSESEGSVISQLDVERALGELLVARFGNVAGYEQAHPENGVYFSQGLSLSHALPGSRSLSYGVFLSGQTQPGLHRESYGPWLTYRSSFLRKWLFYELEPRVTYDRAHDWEAVASLVLRLEVQFGRDRREEKAPPAVEAPAGNTEAAEPGDAGTHDDPL